MIYSTSSKTFTNFLLTKEKLLTTCFPDNSETNLVDMICDFSKSRTTQDFADQWHVFCNDFNEGWNHGTQLTGTLTCDFISLDQRLKLLRDMLGLKEEEMDPLEQYNLAQFLAEL